MKPDAGTPRDKDREKSSQETLRLQAEKRIGKKQPEKKDPEEREELQRLIHELQVHQIELEIQNEELRRARDEIEAGLERYTELYDFAPVGYLTLDWQGTILKANIAGSVLLEMDRARLIGNRFPAFLDNESHPVFSAFCERVIKSGGRQTCEVRLRKSSAQPRVLLVDGGFVQGDTGTRLGIRVALTDITDKKAAGDALILSNKKLNLLSSITRHDIRNQLLSLKAWLEISKKELGDPQKMREYIAKEERAAEAIEHQILFTKEYENLGVKAPVWQDVSSCVKNAAAALPLRDITVLTELPGCEIYADPLCEMVFYNLIDNALRYGGEKMTMIRMSMQESEKGLVIILEDNGNGIAAGEKMNLFERGAGQHTGLGLNLSREILSITGITITEKGEPGKGARFEIAVPKGVYRNSRGG